MGRDRNKKEHREGRGNTLEEQFDGAVMDLIYAKAAEIVTGKLEEQGIVLSKKQRRIVNDAMRTGRTDPIEFKGWKWWDKTQHAVVITAEDTASLEKFAEGVIGKIPELMIELVRNLAPSTVRAIRKEYRKDLKIASRDLTAFEKRLEKRWAKPLADFDVAVELAERLGVTTRARHLEGDGSEVSAAGSVLATLHGRAIRVAREVGIGEASGIAGASQFQHHLLARTRYSLRPRSTSSASTPKWSRRSASA